MAEKIEVEIALEGGDEVTRQLEDIGKAGEQTFSGLTQAADQVDFSNIADGLNKVKSAAEKAAVFEQLIQGAQKVEGAFNALGNAATKMAARMTRSLGLLGVFARALGPVGIAVGALGALFVKAEVDVSNSINGMVVSANKLGITVPQFDRLRQTLSQLGIAADTIVPGLEKLKEALSGDFFQVDLSIGLERLIAELEGMPDGIERTKLAFDRLGESLGASVIAGLQTGRISAENYKQTLLGITPVTQQQTIDAAKYQQSLNGLTNAWTELKTAISVPVIAPVLDWIASQLPGISAGIRTTAREFQGLWSIINQVATVGARVIGALVESVLALGRAVKWAADQFMRLLGLRAQAATPASGGSVGAEGFAGGGLLGGRGTGTSDSNLAWVSRGEYITPARAVAQPGVLSFLEALRRSGGNLSRVLDGMGRFALGGLVPRMPAFATGGLAGGSNVTIQFPGLPPISGLRASSDVVEQLHRAAALAQVRSGGRKPSRYA